MCGRKPWSIPIYPTTAPHPPPSAASPTHPASPAPNPYPLPDWLNSNGADYKGLLPEKPRRWHDIDEARLSGLATSSLQYRGAMTRPEYIGTSAYILDISSEMDGTWLLTHRFFPAGLNS